MPAAQGSLTPPLSLQLPPCWPQSRLTIPKGPRALLVSGGRRALFYSLSRKVTKPQTPHNAKAAALASEARPPDAPL